MVRLMRGREANPDGELGGADLYEVLGDTDGALDSLSTRNKKGAKPRDEYNRLVLSHLVSHSHSRSSSSDKTGGDLAKKLTEWENHPHPINKEARVAPSARKRKRNEWIMTYNRALALHAAGDSIGSIELCLEKLKPLILEDQRVSDELLNVSCRMAFLFLEGIITTSVCCHLGIEQVDNRVTSDMVVDWMDRLDLDEDPQLKFLLALYRSRLDFQQKDSVGRLVDAKIRSARKELKQAMEIFQHKLRPSAGDSSSVDSASYSEEQTQVSASHLQQQIPLSRILQRKNQAALNLKANTEQLKGNIKKSLILCGEAQSAVVETENSSYAMIHTTNLANIYETNGRRHLALHTIAKGLRSNPPASTFEIDGTANPDPTMMILHNAALCALQAHNFMAAYECMVNCVRCSSVMGCRPRCWLRLAEACIGM
jgi:tetratricopeptide (TPR) repeat protein